MSRSILCAVLIFTLGSSVISATPQGPPPATTQAPPPATTAALIMNTTTPPATTQAPPLATNTTSTSTTAFVTKHTTTALDLIKHSTAAPTSTAALNLKTNWTAAPTTAAHTTAAHTMALNSTAAPTTAAPTTAAPTTAAPTSTEAPTTAAPTTAAPTSTEAPTMSTMALNSTEAPTTAAPTTAAPTTAAPTSTEAPTMSTMSLNSTAAPTTAAPTTAATTNSVPELLKKEIEQASKYMGALNEAFDNGNLQENMLGMDAFSTVTGVKLVASLNVQKADANADTPTQLLGSCQLSGISLSDFQDPQRDAFKSAMADSSGAMKEHVLIRNVFARSSRRQLRGTTTEQTSNGDVVVDFAITIVRDAATEPPAEDESQGLAAGYVAAIVASSILAVSIAAAVVFLLLRKFYEKRSQVGFVAQRRKQKSKFRSDDLNTEVTYSN